MPLSWKVAAMLACWFAAAPIWGSEPGPFDAPATQDDFELSTGGWAQAEDLQPGPLLPPTLGRQPAARDDWNAPADFRFTLADDLRSAPKSVLEDLKIVLRPKPVLILVGFGLGSLAIRETVDDEIAMHVADHPNRWGKGTDALSVLGNPGHHFALNAGLYVWSLHTQNAELHDFSGTLFNALLISNTTNYLLKLSVDASTPNGEHHGWPSGHAESTMCLGAVLHENYGWRAALPVYTLAGAVGFSRMDDGEHYFSDVVFGLALGYVVGRTVARHHGRKIAGGEVIVASDPASGTQLLGWQRRY